MKTYLKEKIGNPELFTGRKKEINYFLNWIEGIKREISMSTAILSRRKTGKTALMQRLYNLIFEKNMGVVPFYFEIEEENQWFGDLCENFFISYVCQYIAFKTRKPGYIPYSGLYTLDDVAEIARGEGLDVLALRILGVRKLQEQGKTERMWTAVRETPRQIAEHEGEYAIQMIDEFQFVNRFVYWDREKTHRAKDFAGSWLHTCEYKNAPLLVSGSWVGWLMDDLSTMLPGRFQYHFMENLPEEECVEMIFRYALLQDTPVTEETASLVARMTEGNPFYISAVFRSKYPDKDLATGEGVRKTLEFETLHKEGIIRGTWLEYINSAFPRINDKYAKDIVLYLSRHRDRFMPRDELKKHLGLDMPDYELDKKMDALLKSDIIEEDRFQYRGVQDNIFDKVFRSRYADDIDKFVTQEASDEYKALFDRYQSLSGEHNRYKGAFAEFVISHHLSYAARKENELFGSMMRNLPDDFRFAAYKSVRQYHSPPLHKPEFQLDIFASPKDDDEYSLIWEVKHRNTKKFSLGEAEAFLKKAEELIRLEGSRKYVLIVFSSAGFTRETPDWLRAHTIAWSRDARWLDTHLLTKKSLTPEFSRSAISDE